MVSVVNSVPTFHFIDRLPIILIYLNGSFMFYSNVKNLIFFHNHYLKQNKP